MTILCMDTSHIFLTLALIRDDQVIAGVMEACWKHQSEEFFPKLMAMMDQAHVTPEDIDAVVVGEGPGSYTGVRIAMTAAKVFCMDGSADLYKVSSLQLLAGNESGRVLVDARSHRAYTCAYQNGEATEEPSVKEITEIDTEGRIIGDGHLCGREDVWPDLCANFLAVRRHWEKVDNVHALVPEYLKPSEAYLVKK
ncbi:MAG: tRNA (adenosine(37)-N6)-threonylcarbamoyltransferase complex dimerization subunit type 1 TsaB [Solobacterium sp.]|nr:tRNA (adenosine(37)-N6)-threonylcarbamoyltransferase complex dimerization subunit type 1 TsaB [Solobacterium sp.]